MKNKLLLNSNDCLCKETFMRLLLCSAGAFDKVALTGFDTIRILLNFYDSEESSLFCFFDVISIDSLPSCLRFLPPSSAKLWKWNIFYRIVGFTPWNFKSNHSHRFLRVQTRHDRDLFLDKPCTMFYDLKEIICCCNCTVVSWNWKIIIWWKLKVEFWKQRGKMSSNFLNNFEIQFLKQQTVNSKVDSMCLFPLD